MSAKRRKGVLNNEKRTPLFNRVKHFLGTYWAEIFSILLLSGMIYLLIIQPKNEDFVKSLVEIETWLLTISSIIIAILTTYLVSKIFQIRQERQSIIPEAKTLSLKLNSFSKIAHRLLNSYGFWEKGLTVFLSQEYPRMTHYKVDKIRGLDPDSWEDEDMKKFLNDDRYPYSKELMLELRCMFPDTYHYDYIYSPYDTPPRFPIELLEKWINTYAGNGLWYNFHHQYSLVKDKYDFSSVPSTIKAFIESEAQKIDRKKYKKMSFGPEMLASLGDQIHSNILPELYQRMLMIESGAPRLIKVFYLVLGGMIITGLFLPITNKLFQFGCLFSIISISSVLSLTVYSFIKIGQLINKEIKL